MFQRAGCDLVDIILHLSNTFIEYFRGIILDYPNSTVLEIHIS